MITVGSIMAVAAGFATPGHIILFGGVINKFVHYYIAASNSSAFGNVSLSYLANQYARSLNSSCSVPLLRQGVFSNGTRGNVKLLCDSPTEKVFLEVLGFVCDPRSELLLQAKYFSIYYIFLGIGTFISIFLATTLWNISAYRQTRRIRHCFYHSMLHQEVGWFDVNGTSELSTRLSE